MGDEIVRVEAKITEPWGGFRGLGFRVLGVKGLGCTQRLLCSSFYVGYGVLVRGYDMVHQKEPHRRFWVGLMV